MVKYLSSTKYQAVLSHLFLGGVWTIVLFTSRYFFSSDLKSIIALHAEVVFLSFIMSLGFSTLGRVLVYEKKIALVRQMVIIFFACQSLLASVALILGEQNGVSLAISALYNSLFLMVNLSIAKKSYRYTTIYSLACVGVVLAGSASTVFNFEWLYLIIVSFANFAMLLSLWFRYKKNYKAISSLRKTNFKELLRGPTFLISGLPLRGSIFALGVYFGSDLSSSQEGFLYADALIYYGMVSVVSGRYFLFNEKVMKVLASRRALIFPAYQLALVFPFLLYAFWTSSVGWVVILSISALYSSREIFGLHVAFMDSDARFKTIGLYGIVVVISLAANKLFGHFYFLVPACIFFTFYYMTFRPLKRKEDGINPKEA